MINDKLSAILRLRPTAQASMNNDGTIIYHDDGQQFTDEEIANEIARYEYVVNRVAAYPTIEEQLDLMFHDFDAWKAAIQAVKDAYPKSA